MELNPVLVGRKNHLTPTNIVRNPIQMNNYNSKRPYLSVHEPTLAPLDPGQGGEGEPNSTSNLNNYETPFQYATTQPASRPTLNILGQPQSKTSILPPLNPQSSKLPSLNDVRPNPFQNPYNSFNNPPNNSIIGSNPVLQGRQFPQNYYNPNPVPQIRSLFPDAARAITSFFFEIPKHSVGRPQIFYSFEPAILKQNGTAFNPVCDPELPTVVKFSSQINVCPINFNITGLPALPKMDDPTFSAILQAKTAVCCEILDFTNPQFQGAEKEAKGRILCEIIELFESQRHVSAISDDQRQLIFKLIQANIFDQDPYFPKALMKFIWVVSNVTIVEPAWPHLFYCFQILNRFAQIFPNCPELTPKILKKALVLTQLPDVNERMQIVAFLRTYYDTHPSNRPSVLKEARYVLNDIFDKYSKLNPWSIMPLTVFLTHIYSRSGPDGSYATGGIILESILPILSHPLLNFAFPNVKQLLTTILASNPFYTEKILIGIEKRWPITNSSKQILFLDLLFSLLSKAPPERIKPFSIRLFGFLNACAALPHVGVAGMAIEVWTRCKADEWLIQASRIGINAMFETIYEVSEKCISKDVQEKASVALSEMCKLHKSQYHKLKVAVKAQQLKRTKVVHSNKTLKNWAEVAKMAGEHYNEIEYRPVVHKMKEIWTEDRAKMSRVTRFMSGPPCVEATPDILR